MPDDHSKLAPLLPIPNRTVKRLRADDSADSRVKVGHRQALTPANPRDLSISGVSLLWRDPSVCFRDLLLDVSECFALEQGFTTLRTLAFRARVASRRTVSAMAPVPDHGHSQQRLAFH